MSTISLIPNTKYAQLATEEQIARTAQNLEAHGIHVILVDNGGQAREEFFKLIPEGSQVHSGASETLANLGITAELDKSGRFDPIRPKIFSMDRATQGDQIRRLGASPDFMVGSVQAVTETGSVLIASLTGSQIGPYASGAGKVIWVVGAQKIVPTVDDGLRRIEEYCYPLENERAQKAYGITSGVNKILIVNKEIRPGRSTLILVKESVGS